jgi:hypothetical protein
MVVGTTRAAAQRAAGAPRTQRSGAPARLAARPPAAAGPDPLRSPLPHPSRAPQLDFESSALVERARSDPLALLAGGPPQLELAKALHVRAGGGTGGWWCARGGGLGVVEGPLRPSYCLG